METTHKPSPGCASDEGWAFVAAYLTLLPLDAARRQHDLREVLHALRYLVRTGAPWRMLANDLPPWVALYPQTQRWLAAGSFKASAHDLQVMLRLAGGREPLPPLSTLKMAVPSPYWQG